LLYLLVGTGAIADVKPLKLDTTADHSKFKELQQEFQSGSEVTKACMSETFDFTAQENVDCLVCHETTGRYKKPGGFAGNPVVKDTEFPPKSGKIIKGIDLAPIAQSVAKTRRQNCGTCHFYGGGGDGVKHGDLDSSLDNPDKELDVHMAKNGLNFTCTTCHKTEGHQVPGSRYETTGMDNHAALMRGKPDDKGRNTATCQSCHGQEPHKQQAKLNDHTDKVACQTCHIPEFARGDVPTKMHWDWSTAGKRDKNGKPLVVRDVRATKRILASRRLQVGNQRQADYIWLNGVNKYTLANDKIDKSQQPIYINKYEGSPTDGKSLIWPIKTFTGKQPFDPETRRW
jgi:octaheme c-type cytochrome (tetrathionate reductase family)